MTRLAALGLLVVATGFVACGGASGGTGELGVWTPAGTPIGTTDADGGSASTASSTAGSGGASSSSSTAGAASSSSSAGSSGGGSSSTGPSGAGGSLPCDVASLLAAKCTSCHSDPPINNSLSGLVTSADLTATAKEDPTRNEAQLSIVRMQNTASPMPPTSVNMPATAAEIATLQNWISAGYPSGSCGADAGPAPTPANVFTGQPAFRSQTGPSSHNAGQDCMRCHTTGSDDAPRFSFGGTLYNGQGQAVAGAEVRVVDKNGAAASVYTGPNGNFYKTGTALVTPGQAGARNASATAIMVSAVTAPGCNSCHCTGSGCTTTPMHLP